MARGYPGAFGRKVNAPWVWIPLCAAVRRAVLRLAPAVARAATSTCSCCAAFGVSLAFFNHAQIGTVGPARLPAARSTCSAAHAVARPARGDRPAAARAAPARAGARGWRSALVFLVGFRVGLNVTDSNVIDVGYAGVIGADRLADGDAALRQLPEGQRARRHLRPGQLRRLRPVRAGCWPWSGTLGRPAGRARGGGRSSTCSASLLLFLLGRRVRGPDARRRRSPTRGRPTRSRSTR